MTPPRNIKAISLWQPWASCIAVGAKRIETRSWETLYRGPLLIHAAKRCVRSWMEDVPLHDPLRRALFGIRADWWNSLPFGALIGIGTLYRCSRTEDVNRLDRYSLRENVCGDDWNEDDLGNFNPCRFAWYLYNVRAFQTPVPYKGARGLFSVPYSVVADQLHSIGVNLRPSADQKAGPE